MIKAFSKNIIKYLPAQVVPGIVGLIGIPIITKLFSPADYGDYTLVMATVMVLTTLMGWLPSSIIRFYPVYERDNKLGTFYSNIINLSFISILAVTGIFLVFLFSIKFHVSSQMYQLMSVGIGVVVSSITFTILQNFLRAEGQVNWYSAFTVGKSVGSLGIALLLICFLKRDVGNLLWGAIMCIVIILPVLWKKAVKGRFGFQLKIDCLLTKETTKYAFPLVLGNLAAWILSLSDRYILQSFCGAEEVGIYSVGYNIAERSMMLVVSLFLLALKPMSMHIWESQGESKSKEFVNRVMRYYLTVCVSAIVGLGVLSRPIMRVMTGEEYFGGYKIIFFVAFGIFLLGLQQIFQIGLLFYKRTYLIPVAIMVSGLLNVCLNLLFIPRYGYFAAAITTLISYGCLLFLIIIFSRRFFVLEFPFQCLVKVTCASMIMGIVVYYVGNSFTPWLMINLIAAVLLGTVVYFATLLLLRELSQEELQVLRDLRGRILRRT